MLLAALAVLVLQEAPPVVLGYYPSWATSPAPREVRLERLTHLAHAFLQADATGALIVEKRIPDPELAARAKALGVKALLSLGGAQSAGIFRRIVADASALKRYAAAVAEAAARAGYAGVDLDWEPTESDSDREGLATLVKTLRGALGARATITMAAPAGAWGGRWWDVEGLVPHVDLLNVMSYDFHGPWSAHAGHNAPLKAAPEDKDCGPAACVEGAMTYWRDQRRWPVSKLVVGIPCYGRGFAVKSWGAKPAGKAGPEVVDLKAVSGLVSAGWVRGFDPGVGVPSLVGPSGGLVSFEDAESASLKGAWARRQGFRGIFFWNLEQDWIDGDHELVRAASKAFLGK
jgi:chitinase